MKKNILIITLIILLLIPLLFSECLAEYEEVDIYEFVSNNKDEVLECLYEYDYPCLPQLLDEAYGNAKATKMIFDFAEEIGYWPSSIYGEYCFDVKECVIHKTDSNCVTDIPYENRMSCLAYNCLSKSDVEKVIQINSEFGYTFCPACCD